VALHHSHSIRLFHQGSTSGTKRICHRPVTSTSIRSDQQRDDRIGNGFDKPFPNDRGWHCLDFVRRLRERSALFFVRGRTNPFSAQARGCDHQPSGLNGPRAPATARQSRKPPRASTLQKYKISRTGIHIVPDTVLVDSNDKMTAWKTTRRSLLQRLANHREASSRDHHASQAGVREANDDPDPDR